MFCTSRNCFQLLVSVLPVLAGAGRHVFSCTIGAARHVFSCTMLLLRPLHLPHVSEVNFNLWHE